MRCWKKVVGVAVFACKPYGTAITEVVSAGAIAVVIVEEFAALSREGVNAGLVVEPVFLVVFGKVFYLVGELDVRVVVNAVADVVDESDVPKF